MADTFTRYDIFRRPDSPYACDACAWYLDAQGKRTGMAPHPQFSRMSYIIYPDRWESVTQSDVRALLRAWQPGPPEPVYAVLSRVKKKHLALLAAPWMPGDILTVQWEEERVQCTRAEFDTVGATIARLLDLGVGKMAILAPLIPQHILIRAADPIECGTWFDCTFPGCFNCQLDMSAELRAVYDAAGVEYAE